MNPTMSLPRLLVTPVLLTLAYFVAGKLGLMLAFVHTSATAVWPPTGIALAAFLILGYRIWPAIFLGAFLVNITTEGTVATTLGIATGNTLEGLVGAYLVDRFAHGRHAFDHPQDIFKFTVLTGLLSTTISATFGVTSLALGGLVSGASYGAIWLTWWMGDAAGALIVTPLVLLWHAKPRLRWTRRQGYQAAFLLLVLGFVGLLVFGGLLPTDLRHYPLEYLCVPILVWTASQFGRRVTATVSFLLSGIAIGGTLMGFGPFMKGTPHESLLLLQVFVSVISVMTLALAVTVSERRRTEQKLAQLAAIVESSNDAIVAKALDGRILSWNQAAQRMFGYGSEEVVGQPITILVPPDHRNQVRDILDKIMRGERIDHYETVRVRKDGTRIPIDLTNSPIKDDTGKVIGVSSIKRDVTERKKAEEERNRLVLELSDALEKVKTLRGLLPICAACKKIRNDQGYWEQIEAYLKKHSEAEFTHGMCPECLDQFYPGWRRVPDERTRKT